MKIIKICTILFILSFANAFASPVISGISSNEINIDHSFRGAQILLFGAKGDAGNVVIAVRGPKRNFAVIKKQKLLGIWYNGERAKFKDSNSFYALFSTFHGQDLDQNLLSDLEIGGKNIEFKNFGEMAQDKKNEFEAHLIEELEKQKLYSTNPKKIDFLDETLFKVILDFPKNIARGVYTVEIYLIQEDQLLSFQSIPIYVNQVGISAKILDFAHEESFLYAILAVLIALIAGFLANYLFGRFFGK
jgi:uncharacterized protein (TIGR02186 family)